MAKRPRVSKRDTAALDALRAAAVEYEALQAERDRARIRRDFLILAAWRRGISVRVIAEAAGVHPSLVGQLINEAKRAVAINGLEHLRDPSGSRNV